MKKFATRVKKQKLSIFLQYEAPIEINDVIW